MSSNSKVSLSYRDAGVDIDAGDALVEAIKPFAKRTMREGVLAGIGGFGSLFEVSKKLRGPGLVPGTHCAFFFQHLTLPTTKEGYIKWGPGVVLTKNRK